MAHAIGVAANLTIASAYLVVCTLIAGGIRKQRQWRTNPLAVGTAAIFFSCGIGHWLHVIHLVEGYDPGYDWHLASWDSVTAVAAIVYLSMRSRYGLLLGDGRMYEDELRLQADAQFRAAFEHAPIGIALVSLEGAFVRVNPALCRLLDRPEATLLTTDLASMTHPDDLGAALADLGTDPVERRYLRPDGTAVVATLSVSLVRDDDGEPLHFIAQLKDITARRAAEAQLRDADARFRAAFEDAPVGMALIDPEAGLLVRANPSLEALAGAGDLRSLAPLELIHPDDHTAVAAAALEVLADDVPTHIDARLRRPDGTELDAVLALARVEHGETPLLIVHVLDVTERKRFEGRLRHLADHDPLTGLANRRRFERELTQTLDARRRGGGTAALLLVDLDGFKAVNDTLGHAAGDALIMRVGSLLSQTLRDADLLARLGGDEYAILLAETDAAGAEKVAAKLLAAVREHGTVLVGGRPGQVTASIGIAVLDGSDSADDALVAADLAMYAAKDAGRDAARLFAPDDGHRERATSEVLWLQRLREAPAAGRLDVLAQPILGLTPPDAGEERFELLIRYVDEGGDLVPPAVFLGVAERFDVIGELDRWVLAHAIGRLGALQDAGRHVVFHVNLSGRTLADPGLADHLAALLAARPVAPGSLVIEITETAAIASLQQAQEFAGRLAELGCGLALDDFGAGFASFSYLKHLAFDHLKIDGEFIRNLPDSRTDQLVVRALVDVARGMGIRTIAEFVSGEPCVAALRELGVDLGQGYHLGRPARLEALGLGDPAVPLPGYPSALGAAHPAKP